MRQVFKVVTAAVLVALLSLGSVASGFAQGGAGRPFITKWQGKAGEALKLPIVGADYKLVIKDDKGKVVKTEEKVTVTGEGEAYYHPFTPTADGVYTVEAGPEGVKYMLMETEIKDLNMIFLTSNDKLLKVLQFGTVAWESMKQMFYYCKQMTFATGIDTPDLTKVTNMDMMFYGCTSFNQPLNHWDVSKVTNMDMMFYGCTSFNQPLNNWDVSKVTNMSGMFFGCIAFNQPLEKWDVSNVTDMNYMFFYCQSFNQPLGAWKLQNLIGGLSTTAMSVENYSQSLIGWAKQTNEYIYFGNNVKGLIYNDAGKEAREKLIARGWGFEGDIYQPSEKWLLPSLRKAKGRSQSRATMRRGSRK